MDGSKIFVGGLNWETTDEAFHSFFSTFGEIQEAVIMRDRNSGVSRGFGFVIFKNASALDQVIGQDLELDQRKIECKVAVPREQIEATGHRTKKIFVGGLNFETSTDTFRDYFSQFGAVTEAVIMMDHDSGKSRGFGFITFDTEDAVEKVVNAGEHIISDKRVETKKAVPKSAMAARNERAPSKGSRSSAPPPMPYMAPYPYPAYGYPPMAPYGRDYYPPQVPYGYAPPPAFGYGAYPSSPHQPSRGSKNYHPYR